MQAYIHKVGDVQGRSQDGLKGFTGYGCNDGIPSYNAPDLTPAFRRAGYAPESGSFGLIKGRKKS